jgi:hypothetical protein
LGARPVPSGNKNEAGKTIAPKVTPADFLRKILLLIGLFIDQFKIQVTGPTLRQYAAQLFSYHRQLDGRWILAGVMDNITRSYSNGFIIIVSTGIEVPVESGEITTGDFDPDAMALFKQITG